MQEEAVHSLTLIQKPAQMVGGLRTPSQAWRGFPPKARAYWRSFSVDLEPVSQVMGHEVPSNRTMMVGR